jgi:hypothetical protein
VGLRSAGRRHDIVEDPLCIGPLAAWSRTGVVGPRRPGRRPVKHRGWYRPGVRQRLPGTRHLAGGTWDGVIRAGPAAAPVRSVVQDAGLLLVEFGLGQHARLKQLAEVFQLS